MEKNFTDEFHFYASELFFLLFNLILGELEWKINWSSILMN